jgi:aminoglycoside phosphotransferase (APT) family kinase protein
MAALAEQLTAWIARATGESGARISALRPLAGGASRESWAFDLARADGRVQRLVLRRDPAGRTLQGSRREEFLILRAAAAAGVPVPAVHWCEEDATILGSPFFIMDFVAGETLARRLLRDAEYAPARAALPEQLADALVRIHRMDPGDPTLAFLAAPAAGTSPAAAELSRWEDIYRAATPDPHPAIELALRWLAPRVPTAPADRRIVHGDFRIGNVIFGPEGLRAVLDWELTRIGDPMEDLGWLCVRAWRFGAPAPVGGLCERERLFAAYERAGGVPVDAAAVRWWEVLGNFKWATICIMQARSVLDGAVKSLELASLGRRVAEMEIELLSLTEE